MGILGLTHTDDGKSIQRLPVTVKVAVGRPPDEKAGRKYPSRNEFFLFKTRSSKADTGWEESSELTKKMVDLYGQNPQEIEIVFLDHNIDNVFRANLAWWNASSCKCRGELVQVEVNNGIPKYEMRAVRRTDKHPEGEPWPGNYKYADGQRKGQPIESCGDGCPDFKKTCKPNAELYFLPVAEPALGAVWKIHTTAFASIRNISSALQQIKQVTGGRLAGIPVRLRVDPQPVSYTGTDNKRHKSDAPILSIIFRAEDYRKLISSANEHAKLFEASQKYLPAGTVEILDAPEEEIAREVAAEFYTEGDPDDGEPVADPPKANIPPASTVRQPERASAAPKPAPQPLQRPQPAQPAPQAAKPTNGKNGEPAKITDEQRKALNTAAAQAGWSNKEIGDIVKGFGFANMREITSDKFDVVYKRFTNPDAPPEFFNQENAQA